MNNQNFKKFSLKLLESFPPRNKEVVSRRFGLTGSKKMETLEAIGRDYNVTRERVRQIENDTVKNLKEKIKTSKYESSFKDLEKQIFDVIGQNGNLMREDRILEALASKDEGNFAYFVLSLSQNFKRMDSDSNFYPVWTTGPKTFELAKKLDQAFEKKFSEMGRTLSEQEVLDVYEKELKSELKDDLAKEAVLSYLGASAKLSKTIDRKWGLAAWAEVNPKTIKDKIDMVLKRENKPLHFQDISRLIEDLNSQLPNVKKLSPHIQTVHNELIKSNNFVLVGRGMYALRGWGYEPGQVKDIIAKVLKDSPMPLAKEEIIHAVGKQRAVKESTILSSLRNKNLFAKDDSGRYQVREA